MCGRKHAWELFYFYIAANNLQVMRWQWLPPPFAAAPLTPCLQSAFECLADLLDCYYDRMDAAACISHLESGLQVL